VYVPIGVMKTGGASGNGHGNAPDAQRRSGHFRVDLSGGLHRHVKKPRIGWCRKHVRHTKSGPVRCGALGALHWAADQKRDRIKRSSL